MSGSTEDRIIFGTAGGAQRLDLWEIAEPKNGVVARLEVAQVREGYRNVAPHSRSEALLSLSHLKALRDALDVAIRGIEGPKEP